VLGRDPFENPEALIKRVYAYVAYSMGDGPDAEDVTGETFERALRYRDTFDRNKGEPIAWLIGIARRCIAGAYRREPTAIAVDGPAPGDLAEDVLRRLSLRAAVSDLDERSRELLALRYGADLTARQIGEVLGMRTNAVEVALHRALAQLRSGLDLAADEEPRAKRARAVEAS
jgi:RNA polymerase sigma factor (sigma-70 family)